MGYQPATIRLRDIEREIAFFLNFPEPDTKKLLKALQSNFVVPKYRRRDKLRKAARGMRKAIGSFQGNGPEAVFFASVFEAYDQRKVILGEYVWTMNPLGQWEPILQPWDNSHLVTARLG